VFSLTQPNSPSSIATIQLAVDENGNLRGNYADLSTNQDLPITGAVDRASSRAAWIVGGNNGVVYDTGLGNLLAPSAPLLVHYGPTNMTQMSLVRLNAP
jgi:hypothetical protein